MATAMAAGLGPAMGDTAGEAGDPFPPNLALPPKIKNGHRNGSGSNSGGSSGSGSGGNGGNCGGSRKPVPVPLPCPCQKCPPQWQQRQSRCCRHQPPQLRWGCHPHHYPIVAAATVGVVAVVGMGPTNSGGKSSNRWLKKVADSWLKCCQNL